MNAILGNSITKDIFIHDVILCHWECYSTYKSIVSFQPRPLLLYYSVIIKTKLVLQSQLNRSQKVIL